MTPHERHAPSYLQILGSMLALFPPLRKQLLAELALQFLLRVAMVGSSLMLSQSIVALGELSAAGSAPSWLHVGGGALAFFAALKAFEWLLETAYLWIGSRRHTYAMRYCDLAILGLLSAPPESHPREDLAESAMLLNKKSEARAFLGLMFNHILPPFVEISFACAMLARNGLGQAALALLAGSALYIVLVLRAGGWVKRLWARFHGLAVQSVSFSSEALHKISIAKVFGSQRALRSLIEKSSSAENAAYEKILHILDLSIGLQTLPLMLVAVFLFHYSSSRLLAGNLELGQFILLNTLLISALLRVKNLSLYAFEGLQGCLSALAPHYFIHQALRQAAPADESAPHPRSFESLLIDIECFYGESSAARAGSLRLRPGEKVFLTGRSGSGKSTLFKGLLGLARARGSLIVDGQTLPHGSWRGFGWVPQDSSALAGTLADNLRLCGAEPSEAAMLGALSRVGLADKVQAAGGLGASLDKDGANFSGGERQKLSIARALLSERPVLLLDEPSSALDMIAEKALIDLLMSMESTAMLICVHRIGCIPPGSRVLSFEHGELVEDDTIENLILRKGRFHALWSVAQIEGSEPGAP